MIKYVDGILYLFQGRISCGNCRLINWNQYRALRIFVS